MNFINLYIETEYTMLASSIKIDELIKKALESNCKALAITDLNNMHGVIKFYQKCLSVGIKPIIGLHLTLNSDNNFYNSILLYAKNNQGYSNLLKIASLAQIEKNGLKIEDIYDYLSGIIVIIPNEEHEIVKAYRENNVLLVNKIYEKYKQVKDLYLGLDLQSLEMKYSIDDMINFAHNYNMKPIAIHKTTFLNQEDFVIYEMLKCIGLNIKKYNYSEKEKNQYFITSDKAFELFNKYPKLLEETEKLANICNVNIEFGHYKMPVFDKNIDTTNYLKDLAVIGLRKRLIDNSVRKEKYQLYIDRLMYELSVINKMGFNDYFLIVYDFIKFSKREGILVGPGRGSAPGSLVAYSLGITEIDPIKNELLFERFLNPERISMPDIDTDFPDNAREVVIRYMGKRYTKNRVAHICTFGTFGPRSAVRDVARVMELSSMYLDEIIRCVDKTAKSITDVYNTNSIFRQMVDEDPVIKNIMTIVQKMENLPRNLSVHAAGIIMADNELIDYTPLSEGINGIYQTQYEASDLEKLGLVKIDFLGLRNLTIIDKVIKNIPNSKNFSLYNIPLNDKETYDMLASGNTSGVFQLESPGMTKTIMQLKTSEFSDIVNALALYRPGPMDMIPTFVNRKFSKEEVNYLHPDLIEILKPTYGTIVFQEQILLISSKFAGFTLGEADVLRRAVSKKDSKKLLSEKEKFINGAIKKGYTKELANKIFDYIIKFADYGFNKSHSVAYGLISYQMAYLKKHYLKEFMAVTLSYNIGEIKHIKSYILQLNKAKIEVVPPSINNSKLDFVIDGNKIYYSLLGITGFGEVIVNNIIEERNVNGSYTSYDQFIKRTKDFLPKKNVEALIYAGALDDFKITRKSMIEEYDKSMELASFGSMFEGKLADHVFSDDEYRFEEIANYERMALGFNLKFNIFKKYGHFKNKYKTEDIDNLQKGRISNILFCVDRIKVIKTKNNDEMAFLSVTDDTSELEMVMFSKEYLEYKKILEEGRIYVGEIRVDIRNDSLQGIIRKLYVIDDK